MMPAATPTAAPRANAIAAQHRNRFEPYVLDALRGDGLDTPAPAPRNQILRQTKRYRPAPQDTADD
ncbi:hypothetical protein ACFC36_36410 [Streptomyces rubiginosohelvolus]|uniref:hypothetical protein n=1 Tax=Streptomyces rubiginosohelvolus TaxID=67362 RepID=UPI0035DEB292